MRASCTLLEARAEVAPGMAIPRKTRRETFSESLNSALGNAAKSDNWKHGWPRDGDARILGGPGKLRFVLNWRDDYESAGPVSRTWADLQVWVEDTLVWGHLRTTVQTEGITWSWIEAG